MAQEESLDSQMEVSTITRFSQDIVDVQQRVAELRRQITLSPEAPNKLLEECLVELEITVEELQTAQEELAVQNEELALSREEAEANAQRYEDLFEFAPVGYLVSDLHGTIQKLNVSAFTLLNVDRNKVIGKPLAAFIPAGRRREFRSVINQLSDRLQVQNWEMEIIPKQREPMEASLTVQLVENLTGDSPSLRWIIQDIRDRKRAERELDRVRQQNLDLAAADRLKQQFLNHVSHELRTPLNAILGFASLLERRLTDASNLKMVRHIQGGGNNLLAMVNELLDYSRMSAGRLELKTQPFDLCRLIQEVMAELEPLANQKLLKLEIQLPENLMIENDPRRVRQILTNLVANAIAYTPQGEVVVKLAVLEERLILRVRDTGIGIAPEDQPHVFKEFWQVRSSQGGRPHGTGLGLPIVQAIVRAMEGSISIESRLHQGTTFRVELPRQIRGQGQQLR